MTDITELAQRMRTAAEKAGIEQWVNNRGEVNTADYEVDGGMYIDHICDCEIVGTESPRAEFIALANPANILALVKALEKAKGMETYWKTQCRGITDHCEELQARIAELESRTVTPVTYSENADADYCRKWAWEQVKGEVSTEDWTTGDSITYFGFFCWGWDMRRQYNEQHPVTVKLPQRLQPDADGWDDWYVHSDDEGEYLKFDDVLAMLTAADIKWEAE
ncbi:TPA: ead/Ea22-like family protein [Klebsiella variicola]|nr:ead/Ea22-like family protein [Klebsiella variicola]